MRCPSRSRRGSSPAAWSPASRRARRHRRRGGSAGRSARASPAAPAPAPCRGGGPGASGNSASRLLATRCCWWARKHRASSVTVSMRDGQLVDVVIGGVGGGEPPEQVGDGQPVLLARRALPARLDGQEAGDAVGDGHEIVRLVEHDEPRRAEAGAGGVHRLERQRGVERRWPAAAGARRRTARRRRRRPTSARRRSRRSRTRSAVPIGTSPTPAWRVEPDTVQIAVPGDSAVPTSRNHVAPLARISGTLASVSTLLASVGGASASRPSSCAAAMRPRRTRRRRGGTAGRPGGTAGDPR